MQHLRVVIRILLTILWTLLVALFAGIGSLLLYFSRPRRVRLKGWVVYLWSRGLSIIFGMRIRSRGTPPLPPFCLVTNHLSYLDILLIGSRVRTVFISRGDVRHWPAVGFVTRVGGTIFINRADRKDIIRVGEEMERTLARGGSVTFFPESTTSRGDAVYPFKPPLLDLPARQGIPVAYAALSYRTPPGLPPAEEVLCWWGGVSFARHVLGVLRLPHFEALIEFGPDMVRSTDRKELARLLEQSIRERFEPATRLEHHVETLSTTGA